MSLFDSDTDSSGGSSWADRNDDEPGGDPRRAGRSRRERVGRASAGIAIAVGLVFALLPTPYVIEQPGPVYDTLGSAEHDGEEVPLISIPNEETYPTEGALDLLTVSVRGKPGATPNWFEVAGAWFDQTKSAVPVETIFPPSVTSDQREAQNQAAMVNSQQDAIAAALVELEYDFPREVTVQGVTDQSPAAGVLEDGDVIEQLDGEPMHSINALRAATQENGADAAAELVVQRDGEQLALEVTPVQVDDGPVLLGIGVRMNYEFPIDVELQLDNVGGPSAGMMFALGIVDKLTPGSMNGGESFAGTGTIDSDGVVGPIGGIRQKLWGANDAGAGWFLAPEANCGEVVGNTPDGMRVFSIATLDQAREVVEAVGSGGDLDAFATCASS